MARYEKKPEHKFSRVKNHLAELQKWWPVYIKNDTDLGISIDPVLFKSQFSSYQNDNDITDEATTAGVRVEAINPDGTDITGTEPTITISGSGTYNPRCRITHSDGSFTEFLMIAPTVESASAANQVTFKAADNAKSVIDSGANVGKLQDDTTSTIIQGTNTFGEVLKGFTQTNGPYPVFMTIQEFVETIDSYRHIGLSNDSEKRAFLPFGVGSTARMPIVNSDPRVSGDVAFPVAETYRATVFMPMLLDSNQLAKQISGATNAVGSKAVYAKNGTTRYNQNPLEKHTDVQYKRVGTSGDFKLDLERLKQPSNQRTANSAGGTYNDDGLSAGDSNPMETLYHDKANSHIGAPSYRMSMALACFLKDGTYSLNNGTIIPYSYDSRRYIGGTQTTSLYAVWDGGRGWGDDESGGGHDASYDKFTDGSPAGIYPYFDFIQGPVSPQAQGTNWNYNVIQNYQTSNELRNHLLVSSAFGVISHDMNMNQSARPQTDVQYLSEAKFGTYGMGEVYGNPRPMKCVAVDWDSDKSELGYWVYQGEGFASGSTDHANRAFHIPVGVPIYVEGIDLVNSGNAEFAKNNGVTKGRFKNTSMPSKDSGRITYERMNSTNQTNNGYQSQAEGTQPFQFNGWWLHRKILYHGLGNFSYNATTKVADGYPYLSVGGTNSVVNNFIAPNTIVAGCAAEHFGGNNGARSFVKYIVHIPAYMKKDVSATIGASGYTTTLLTPAGSSVKTGRNYGKAQGIGVKFTRSQYTSGGSNPPSSSNNNDPEEYHWYKEYPLTTASRFGGDGRVEDIGSISFNPFFSIGDAMSQVFTGTSSPLVGQIFGSVMNYGFSIGMGTSDSNVPSSSSLEDTLGGRPKFTDVERPNSEGIFEGISIVPRSIQIETIGSNNNTNISSAPMISGKGQGSLRIPAPLGHDLAQRYNSNSFSGSAVSKGSLTVGSVYKYKYINYDGSQATDFIYYDNNFWLPRGDLMGGAPHLLPNKWAYRGVSTPLWSYMDSATGSHAWDYVKPDKVGTGGVWDFGRNRPFPAHEREGTRLAMTPALDSYSIGYTKASADDTGTIHHVQPNQETTLIGLSETGCSPIHLDMEMTAYIPEVDNRLFIIEFDQNESDSQYGRHAWLGDTFNRDAGWGFHPRPANSLRNAVYRVSEFVDKDQQINVPDPNTDILNSDADGIDEIFSRPARSLVAQKSGGSVLSINFENRGGYGGTGNFASRGFPYGGYSMAQKRPRKVGSGGTPVPVGFDGVFERTAIWFMSSNTHYTTAGVYAGGAPFALGGKAGMGRISSNAFGATANYTEGTQVIRATFTEEEMIFSLNGDNVSRAVNTNGEVWGVSIKSCNLFTFVNREPNLVMPTLNETTPSLGTGNPYVQLQLQEPVSICKENNAEILYPASSGVNSTSTFFGYSLRRTPQSNVVGQSFNNVQNYAPAIAPEHYAKMVGDKEVAVNYSTPSLAQSNKDVQIDELTFRHLPTPAMLPFTVDTTVMLPPTGTIIAKYTALQVYADHIDVSKNRNITVSLFEKPTLPTNCQIAREATVPIADFQDLDLFFVQGIGLVDLENLPTTYITDGFIIRFNFHMPSTEDTELHPVNFRELPTITKWELLFDHKPTSNVAVIGNTFNGQTATTVGQSVSPTITTKVGHIVSARIFGDTIDPDRKISEVKIDFGDGTDSGFLPIAVPALNVSLDISHVYSSTPTSPATFYEITAQSKDDNNNISDISLSIKVQVNGAEPVSILRAIPTLVRAGQSIRFDGSQSYTLNTEATISNYTFDFGDGSSTVSGAQTFQDHTYAVAGEYQATLIVTDSASNVSPVTSCVIKVLPATTIVPLRLQTKPSSFSRTRRANLTQTAVLDSIYPEISDTGQRADEFNLRGMFLKGTQDRDIQYMEELLLSGSLVEIEWQEVNFDGVPDSKTFIGRIVSFDYNRQGGSIDSTPYTATFIRESGLGV